MSQNLYAYCVNNPVLYIDPSGNIKICQYDDLYWGMGASLGDTLKDLLATPEALMELARAVKSGQLSVEDLRQALGGAFEPLRYVASTSGLVWFGEPTDKQVYEYGRNLGFTLQMAAGGAGGAAAAKVISKAAPRLAKALERLVKGNKGTGNVSSVGAARRLTYEISPKHGPTARGSISAAPRNGQEVLDLSIQVKPTSPRRVGIDYETGEFNVFDQTSVGIFHGHVRTWDQLTSEMQSALRKSGMVDARGNILGGY